MKRVLFTAALLGLMFLRLAASEGAAPRSPGNTIITPERFGAPHDGLSDDGPAFQAMADWAARRPGVRLALACNGVPYRIDTPVTFRARVRLSGCGTFAPSIKVAGAITALTLAASAPGSVIDNLAIAGTRTPGQVGIAVIGANNLLSNIELDLLDTGIRQPHTPQTGFFNRYSHIYGRNDARFLMDLQDGVGPIIEDVAYDTDGVWYPHCGGGRCYPAPSGAAIRVETEGTLITDPNLIHGGRHGCLWIEADPRHHANGPIWTKVSGGYVCDSNLDGPGVLITNRTGGTTPLHGVFLQGTWSCTNQRGLYTETDRASTIDSIEIAGGQYGNNLYDGMTFTGNTGHILLQHPVIAGNDATFALPPGYRKTPGVYSNLSFDQTAVDANGYFSITGGQIGRFLGFNSSPNYNISVAQRVAGTILDTYTDSLGVLSANYRAAGGARVDIQSSQNLDFAQRTRPGLAFGGGAAGIAYAKRIGYWTRAGNEISFHFDLALRAKGRATGAATLTGLPFAANAEGGLASGQALAYYAQMKGLSGTPTANAIVGRTSANLYQSSPSGVVPLTDANFTDGAEIAGVLTFLK